MYRQMLKVQWIASRNIVLVFIVLAFAAPLATVYLGGGLKSDPSRVSQWLSSAELIGGAMPILALIVGVSLGVAVWAPDHAGKHVYAMALPLTRWQFILLRFATGATLIAPIVLALGAGAMLATLAVDLPSGVHAYPTQLTVRFALAALVCFALFFSLASATRQTMLAVLGVIGGLVLADILQQALGGETAITEWALNALTRWPGPLAILVGRWALFDV